MSTISDLKAIGHFIFVKRAEPETEIEGILLPETNLSKPNTGEIVSVGGGVQDKNIKAGKQAVFNPSAGFPIEIFGETLHVLNEGQVLAIC